MKYNIITFIEKQMESSAKYVNIILKVGYSRVGCYFFQISINKIVDGHFSRFNLV